MMNALGLPPAALFAALQGMGGGQQPQQPQQPQFKPQRLPGGFLNVLGQLGDVLATMGGRDPTYRPEYNRRRVQNAFGEFAMNPDGQGTFANFLAADPATAWKVMQDRMEQARERDKLGILRAKEAREAATPEVIEIDGIAFDKRTGQPLFESPYPKVYQGPQGGFVEQPRLGLGRTVVAPQPEAGGGMPRVSTREQYEQLPPGTEYIDARSGEPKRKGGAGPQGPRRFP